MESEEKTLRWFNGVGKLEKGHAAKMEAVVASLPRKKQKRGEWGSFRVWGKKGGKNRW